MRLSTPDPVLLLNQIHLPKNTASVQFTKSAFRQSFWAGKCSRLCKNWKEEGKCSWTLPPVKGHKQIPRTRAVSTRRDALRAQGIQGMRTKCLLGERKWGWVWRSRQVRIWGGEPGRVKIGGIWARTSRRHVQEREGRKPQQSRVRPWCGWG